MNVEILVLKYFKGVWVKCKQHYITFQPFNSHCKCINFNGLFPIGGCKKHYNARWNFKNIKWCKINNNNNGIASCQERGSTITNPSSRIAKTPKLH